MMRVVLTIVVASVIGFGCGVEVVKDSQSGSQTKPASTTTGTQTKPATAQQEDVKPATAAQSVVPNGSFEEWDGKAPKGWNTSIPALVQVSSDAYDGEKAVEFMQAEPDRWGRLEYFFKPEDAVLGKKIHVTMMGKASAPKLLVVAIEYTLDGKNERADKTHPGDGAWHAMDVDAEIPAGVDPGSVVLKAFRRPGKEGSAIVDLATVVVVE
ncbi:MAG TPA: hypothetical protein ENN80_14385 [Candidatus Hydrogenedentes bacterium]|nr:hypothetical protein [Candidatus Hydrogenedentota bacterium]